MMKEKKSILLIIICSLILFSCQNIVDQSSLKQEALPPNAGSVTANIDASLMGRNARTVLPVSPALSEFAV
jgi:hypothetical protein